MAILKFFIAIFKKIKNLFSKKKGKDAGDPTRLPGERRIGIYGPSNVGKSVFFTMLYKACRQDREFNLSPDDPNTGKQLVNNLNTLRSGEWLPGTVEESELNFKASLRGGSQFPFSTRDYKGETVDLEQEGAAKEQLIQYFQSCDAILFLLSPEMIADPRKCEREIMSFTAMINQVTEKGGRGLRIPIGLMITKADAMDGFENQTQVALIDRKAEYLKAKDFQTFVEGVCGQYHVARNIVFQEQVRDTMHKLALFFDFLMTLSMEFQVFFVSSVGHVRTLEEDGKKVARPPEDPDGIGVKTPFLWIIETIRRKEKIAAFNGARRFVLRLSIVVLLFYSIFYGLHLLPGRDSLVAMSSPEVDLPTTTIQDKLAEQKDRWVVRNFYFFPLPGANASKISEQSEKLHARYRAHRFLSEDLARQQDSGELESLAGDYGSRDWGNKQPWYGKLLARQQGILDESVWSHVRAHNLEVAVSVREVQEAYRANPDSDAQEVQAECERLLKGFVEPQEGRDEYTRLVERARDICTRISLEEGERAQLAEWDIIVEELERVTSYPSPLQDDVSNLRQSVSDFETSARRSGSANLLPYADLAKAMRDLLTNMQMALGVEADERGQYLDKMRGAQGPLESLSRWAGRARRDLEGGRESERIAQVTARVLELSASPTAEWTLGRGLESQVKGVRLRGAKEQARQLYLANLNRLRTEGMRLTMSIIDAPDRFNVLYHDPVRQEWDRNEATKGFTLEVLWKAGTPIKLGVRGVSESLSEPCEAASGYIFDLNNSPLQLRCPGTGGANLQVSFAELQSKLDEQLARPLTEAFAQ